MPQTLYDKNNIRIKPGYLLKINNRKVYRVAEYHYILILVPSASINTKA